ncbi:hypothetical protein C8J57DRAFT_1592039 [Mycena rebaudengoi]|nr:hypothetical protein C8J57DRAFT_1592039 [Mycena rebaudengoi]
MLMGSTVNVEGLEGPAEPAPALRRRIAGIRGAAFGSPDNDAHGVVQSYELSAYVVGGAQLDAQQPSNPHQADMIQMTQNGSTLEVTALRRLLPYCTALHHDLQNDHHAHHWALRCRPSTIPEGRQMLKNETGQDNIFLRNQGEIGPGRGSSPAAERLNQLTHHSSTLATPESSHKARRIADGAIQLPADRNASPRDTPKTRKSYRPPVPPPITALDVAGTSSLSTSTGDIFSPSSNEDSDTDDDLDRPTRPLPFRTHRDAGRATSQTPSTPAAAPSPRPPSPPASVSALSPRPPSPTDTVMSDGDQDMNGGGPPPIQQQQPPPPPQQQQQPPPPPPVMPPPIPPFVLPEDYEVAAVVPAARARNPHLRFLAAQAAPPINPELGRARFQQSTGQFRANVITNARLLYAVAPTQLADFNRSPDYKFAVTIANGGDHVLHRVPFEIGLTAQVTSVLRAMAPQGSIVARLPLPDPDFDSRNKYGGPSSILVEISDAAGAAAVAAQQAFGVHSALVFWAHDLVDNASTETWAFGHFNMVVPGVDADDIEAQARGGFVTAAFKDDNIYRLTDQLTQGSVGEPRRRVFDALNTAHFELLPHPDKPVVIGYIKPLTNNPAAQEQLNKLLRCLSFWAGNYGFTPRSKAGNAPECVYCKSADHPTFHCHFLRPELKFWGPPAQLSELPPENPLYSPSNVGGSSNGRGGGTPGRGGGGYGGYSRGGGGGRGSPYGGYTQRGGGRGGWRNARGGGRGRGNTRGYY